MMSISTRVLMTDRKFQKLFIARTISNIGNGIAPIALAFGILDLEGATPTSLSLVLAAQALPMVIVLPIGGVIADRLGRARVIAASDIAISLVVAVMGLLFITGTATIPLLVVLSIISGALNGLWYPAYPGLVPDVVDDEHLQPANAYISVASNAGLIVGSAVGGLLVALFGSGVAIMVDSASFLVAGFLVFTFRHASKPHTSGESMLGDLTHGWRLFISYKWVVAIVLSFSVAVMVIRGVEEVMGPVLANESYGGPAGWAFVLGSMSVGLLIGAVVASKIHASRPLLFGMTISFAFPLWVLSLAFTAPLLLVAIGALIWGIAIELFMVLWFTALQTHIPREALSRVSAYDAMGSLMFGPIGLALAGPLIAFVGLKTGFLLAAGIMVLALLGGLLSKSLRDLRAAPRNTDAILE